MATLDRIESKKAFIEKKKAVIVKKTAWIEKKRAIGDTYSLFDIEILENDIAYAIKDIKYAENELQALQAKYELEQKKESSRNIQVILDFLEKWKERAKEFYTEAIDKYFVEYEICRAETKEIYHKYSIGEMSSSEYGKQYKQIMGDFQEANKAASQFAQYNTKAVAMEKMNKAIDTEAIRKYDDLSERVMRITGEITDASGLTIGCKSGELNGIIVGKAGKCYVETIGAGGYNIQCYHYRVLVKPIK